MNCEIIILDYIVLNDRKKLTCLFPEEVCVATVMAHIAVKHIIGHEGQTGSVEEEKTAPLNCRGGGTDPYILLTSY